MNAPTNIQRTSPSRRHTSFSLAWLLLRGGLSRLLLSLLAVTVGVLMASGAVLAQQQESTTAAPEQALAQELALVQEASSTAPSYTVKDLGTLPGSYDSGALGINDSGQIVGYSTISTVDNSRAFLYSGGQMKDLGALTGASSSTADDINDSGEVVGAAGNKIGTWSHAFLYSGGQIKDLGTLAGGTHSGALGINDSGQIVGYSTISTGDSHAFLYSGGQMKDLGTLPGGINSRARAINNTGQIVGSSYSIGANRAFLYSGGQMHNLNNLIPAGSGWVLEDARAINTSGQIVGRGLLNGQGRAFLATPDTIDTTPPTVISTIPKANATEVAPTINVKATFSEEVQRASVKNAFKLFKKGTTTQIAAEVSYNDATDTAALDPNNNLRRGVTYKAVVTTVAKDLAGNRLDQDPSLDGPQQMKWFFTIRS